MAAGMAIITGASSGLGREFALQLAEGRLLHLVLVARRLDRLEELASQIRSSIWESLPPDASDRNPDIHCFRCDLSIHAERVALLDKLRALKHPIDWLVNNAGFGTLGSFAESDTNRELQMVELNCSAPLHLMRELLPEMKARGSGTVINVCSTAAYQPMSYMATYGATKAFLLSLSTAAAAELKGSGVKIMAHCPGPTDSEFHLVVGLEDKLTFLPGVSATKVVAEAVAAARAGRRIFINGRLNFWLAQLNRLLPRYLAARVVELSLRGTARKPRAAAPGSVPPL